MKNNSDSGDNYTAIYGLFAILLGLVYIFFEDDHTPNIGSIIVGALIMLLGIGLIKTTQK